MKYSRRSFIKKTALTSALLPFANASKTKVRAGSFRNSKIYFFTKCLDEYENDFMNETLAMLGVDGLDLTVRGGGKVEPERVTEDLPKVVESANKHNLATELLVTRILGTEERETEDILKTASALGVKHYRLGYYDYDQSAGVQRTIATIKDRLKSLSEMNRRYNIQASYQNHVGHRVGHHVWDIWEIIKDFPVATISNQFDIRHATVAGERQWMNVLDLLAKHIGSLAIKDFTYRIDNNGRLRVINVPLGEGLIDFDLYFKTIGQMNIQVPITLHVEYPVLSESEERYSLLQQQKLIVQRLRKDVQFIRSYMA